MSNWKRANTDWFQAAKWGTFTHYLGDVASDKTPAQLDIDDWNRRVDSFDVDAFAQRLAATGSRYHFLTIGQCSGFFCSPNETYDNLVGRPSRLSKRDLMGDLADALTKVGIRAMAYLPSHAPSNHREAVEALGFTPEWDASAWGLKPGKYLRREPTDERLTTAQRNWEAVIREWSLRWGTRVHGWWIDGCYHADMMYRHVEAPNFRSFAEAMKAGNPESLVAFNPGVLVPIVCHCECDDYTAGEANVLPTPNVSHKFERFKDGAQFHVLSYLANWWGSGEPRYPDELPPLYTRYINGFGGVVTWDVPISPDGRIPGVFLRQLDKIGNGA